MKNTKIGPLKITQNEVTVHSGANFRFFVWLSTDKKKNNVFVYTFYTFGQILKEICMDLLNQV